MGVSPEEIPQGLPHLSLAQVFDALSYYSDHQDEINAYIMGIFPIPCITWWILVPINLF